MGITERKEREKELKRAMILEEAQKLILEKGLDCLNMDEVAERAVRLVKDRCICTSTTKPIWCWEFVIRHPQ